MTSAEPRGPGGVEAPRDLERRQPREGIASPQRGLDLGTVALELTSALSTAELMRALLAVAERHAGASAGVLYITRDGDESLHLAGKRGELPMQDLAMLAPHQRHPVAQAVARREPLWFESQQALSRRYPEAAREADAATGVQAFAALPLIHGEVPFGCLALGFREQRSLKPDQREWLCRFAALAAAAAERTRRYEAERQARGEAETLLRINESLSAKQLDLEALVQNVTDEATRLVDANFGAFFYNVVSDSGEAYVLYSLSGASKQAFSNFGLPRNTPLFAPTFAGEGAVRLADVTDDPRYGKLGPHHGMPRGHLPVTSYLAVPVVSRSGAVLGGLFFGHRERGRFTEQHERMASALAKSAALAIDTARLFVRTSAREQSQRQRVAQLSETAHMNSLLAGVLAHDLRNPLGSIINSAELALKKSEASEVAGLEKPLRRIVTSGERMSRMIERLLDVARLRIGSGLELATQSVELAELVRRGIDEIEGARSNVKFEFESRGDTRGKWDPDRLLQIFSNLLGNAAQHGVHDSGVRVSVDGSDPNRVVAAVQNMGEISADILKSLSAEELQTDLGGKAASGLGLGLFISREIAAAHAGTLDIASTPEHGTCVTLSLPRSCEPSIHGPAAQSSDEGAGPRHGAEQHAAREWARDEHFGENEQKFRLLVESVKDYAIFMLDPSGRVATWNAGAERIKGYAAREIIGQHFSCFYEEEAAATGICAHALEVAAREGRFENEGYRVRKDGSRFWANVVITALRGPGGDLFGFAKVTRDLTERKKLEEERVRRAQAEEAVRLRDEFLSVVSHEFKTPLGVLRLQLEALAAQEVQLSPPLIKNVQRARRSGEQLLRLVDSALEAARIATGTFAISRQPFDLADAVEASVDIVQAAAAGAGCQLVLQLERPMSGSWDRRRIRQAVTHLLWNAITYAAGKPVHVTLARQEGEAVLEIADGGPGIGAEDLERIFERFERASSLRHYSGLGLGLYITREVARAHGGDIGLHDTPSGACFRLRLPFGPSVSDSSASKVG